MWHRMCLIMIDRVMLLLHRHPVYVLHRAMQILHCYHVHVAWHILLR